MRNFFTLGFLVAFLALSSLQPPFASGVPPRACIAIPDRPELAPKQQKPPTPIPQIAGPSLWGDITQVGRKIKINGHDRWHVEDGEIRKDGKLFVMWIQNSDGKLAPGLYVIDKQDGSIEGRWAMVENTTTDADGEIHGMILLDTLRAKPMPPEAQ